MKSKVGKLEGEAEGGRGWSTANQKAAPNPPGSLCPSPFSPPVCGLGEHADCWLSTRGLKGSRERSWDQLQKSEQPGQASQWSRKSGARFHNPDWTRISPGGEVFGEAVREDKGGSSSREGGGGKRTERQGTPGPSRALSFRHRKLLSQCQQSLSRCYACRTKAD